MAKRAKRRSRKTMSQCQLASESSSSTVRLPQVHDCIIEQSHLPAKAVNILECCPDEKVEENGRNAGETIVKDLLLTMGVTPNYAFVICLVKKLLSEFAGWFECDHHIMEDKEVLH